jgi:hypothetical protein
MQGESRPEDGEERLQGFISTGYKKDEIVQRTNLHKEVFRVALNIHKNPFDNFIYWIIDF